MYARGQWLVPKFSGIRRIKRQRQTQMYRQERALEVPDQAVLKDRVQAAETNLNRYFGMMATPLTADPQYKHGEISARPEDQPQLLLPTDVIGDAIAREALIDGKLIAQKLN